MPIRSLRPTTLPADILPPDFIERHGPLKHLVLGRLRERTRPRP